MLFSNTGILPHQSIGLKAKARPELTGLSVGWWVVASAGGENIRDLTLRRGSKDGIRDSEAENG